MGKGELFDVGKPHKRPKQTATPFSVGTGPEGETCGTCAYSIKHLDTYWKCGEARNAWTNSVNSDIRLKWPACRGWNPRVAKQ